MTVFKGYCAIVTTRQIWTIAAIVALNCTGKTQVSGCLDMPGGIPLDMPRTPYRASKGKRSQ